MASIRTVLALAASLGLRVRSINISNAFLNGNIDADVYMAQPEGFACGGRNMVCKLCKALYGTKQGARTWQIKLCEILVNKLKFKAIYSDGSFFVYRADNDFVLLPFHVDDGTLAASSDELIDRACRRSSSCATSAPRSSCSASPSRTTTLLAASSCLSGST